MQTLNAALHMDLFECLHEKWLSVDQISELSSVHPPKTFLPELCDTLTALNLIAKRKNEDGIGNYIFNYIYIYIYIYIYMYLMGERNKIYRLKI